MRKRATPSAFSDWVLRQNNPKKWDERSSADYQRQERLRLGVLAHRDIDRLFLMHTWTQDFLGPQRAEGWELFFADNKETPDRIFTASRLRVDGQPLACIPDVVLVRENRKEVIIIERKTTFVPEIHIPAGGWPNVQVQLWCYSWIDEFLSAEWVALVGQMWTRLRGDTLSLCRRHPAWERGMQTHEADCEQWFRLYGGSVGAV